MPYHINAKTKNPNVCHSKSCTLEHFETKEEAKQFGLGKETVGDKLTHAVSKVEQELVKDEVFQEAKAEGKPDAKAETEAEEAAKIAEVRAQIEAQPVQRVTYDRMPMAAPTRSKFSRKLERAVRQIRKDVEKVSKWRK